MLRKPLWLLVLGAALGCAAPACVGGPDETNLNPQPLPPRENEKTGDGDENAPGTDRGTGDSSGTSSSGGMSPPQASTDAGAGTDGGDAGDDGGD
jgi:hypothetical protein